MNKLTTVQVLRGAKRELKRRGLWKGDFFKENEAVSAVGVVPPGPCCVAGACMAALGSIKISVNTERALGLAIPGVYPNGMVSAYNDLPGVNRTHLYALLDRAIAIAKRDNL